VSITFPAVRKCSYFGATIKYGGKTKREVVYVSGLYDTIRYDML